MLVRDCKPEDFQSNECDLKTNKQRHTFLNKIISALPFTGCSSSVAPLRNIVVETFVQFLNYNFFIFF